MERRSEKLMQVRRVNARVLWVAWRFMTGASQHDRMRSVYAAQFT